MSKSRKRSAGVGYVLRRFPKISETFILNEILALEAEGEAVSLFSLLPSRDPRFHGDLSKLKALVHYLPGPLEATKLLRYNWRSARRSPRRYLRALFAAVRTRRPRMLWRLVQGGYVAERARGLRLRHLHAHFADEATSVASLAAGIAGIPYSFTAHAVDIYKNDVEPTAIARKIDRAKFVVTVSECNKDYLCEIANGSANKIVRIYNGIDLARFQPNGAASRSTFTILSVARLVGKKGLDVLIEACGSLRERDIAFQCWIVGKGNQRRALEAMIRQRQLGGQVQLLGAHTQQEILRRYHAADLFVLPCRVAADGNRDGLPVSIVEALACGVPVVATPVTGIPEVVQPGRNGLLVEADDPEELAHAIESVIRDSQLHGRLRSNARGSVAERFDLRETAAELRKLLLAGTK